MSANALEGYVEDRPQSQPILGREDEMVKNSAGGFVFTVEDWDRLDRFLMLGTEGGTYYVKQGELTQDNAATVRKLIGEDGDRVIARTIAISKAGRAPKNDQALFVLALCAAFGDKTVQAHALDALPQVARIGTHLFFFVSILKKMRGFGPAVKRALSKWYGLQETEKVAYQVTKYRQRHGWSHRDVLRVAHPRYPGSGLDQVLSWVAQPDKYEISHRTPELIKDFIALQKVESEAEAAELVNRNKSLSHEMVPTKYKGKKVWKALLPNLPMTALIRNLPTLTRLEVLKPMTDSTHKVVERLTDNDQLHKARIHPLQMLIAGTTYSAGRSYRGSTNWAPIGEITSALSSAFDLCFHNLEPIDKRIYIGMDVSGSMFWNHPESNLDFLYPGSVAIALSKCLGAQCKRSVLQGFSHKLIDLSDILRMDVVDAVSYVQTCGYGGTDCSLPMVDAMQREIPVDAFIVFTDNETYFGDIHPAKALEQYRQKMGIPAKLIVAGLAATEFTIADPKDSGMLDIVGFDAALPQVINEFISPSV